MIIIKAPNYLPKKFWISIYKYCSQLILLRIYSTREHRSEECVLKKGIKNLKKENLTLSQKKSKMRYLQGYQ